MFRIKRYIVQVTGFPDVEFFASSPGKARAKAFRSYQCADSNCTFKRFLQISRVIKNWKPAPAHFGKQIWVADEQAYYINFDGQYVHFVRPDEDTIMASHPLDVMRPWMQGGGNGSVPF